MEDVSEERHRKKKDKKDKKKKEKHHKSKKHHKHKRSRSPSPSRSSSDAADAELMWVEKTPGTDAPVAPAPGSSQAQSDETLSEKDETTTTKAAEREEWMSLPKGSQNLFRLVGRDDKKKEEERKREEEKTPAYKALELNPTYNPSAPPLVAPKRSQVADGGASWLRVKLNAAKQQAIQEGVPIQQILDDRILSTQQAQASSLLTSSSRPSYSSSSSSFRRPGRARGRDEDGDADDTGERNSLRNSFLQKRNSSSSSTSLSQVDSQQALRKRSRSRERERERGRDRSRSGSRERKRHKRSRSNSRSRERHRHRSDRDCSRERKNHQGRDNHSNRDRDRDHERDHYRHERRPRSRSRSRSRSNSRSRRDEEKKASETPKQIPGKLQASDIDSYLHSYLSRQSSNAPPSSPPRTASPPRRQRDPSPPPPSSSRKEKEPEVAQMSPEEIAAEKNRLKAQSLRAKLKGDHKTSQELEKRIEQLSAPPKKVEILSQLDIHGRPINLGRSSSSSSSSPSSSSSQSIVASRQKLRPLSSVEDGEPSIDDMVHQERMADPRSGNFDSVLYKRLSKQASKNTQYDCNNDPLDVMEDDAEQVLSSLTSSSSSKQKSLKGKHAFTSSSSSHDHTKKQQIQQHQMVNEMISKCFWCYANAGKQGCVSRQLIISLGEMTYLALPSRGVLVPGHCVITTIEHETNHRQLNDGAAEEVKNFKKQMQKMFASQDMEAIFFETATNLHSRKKQKHLTIECVPLPNEVAQDAPMFFQKGLMECEKEFEQQNRSIIKTNAKTDLRRSIPEGFPYFHVEFGSDRTGFVHIIEDESRFPKGFAREILGGMLQLDPSQYLRAHSMNPTQLHSLFKTFLGMWSPFDWTRCLDDPSFVPR